MVRAFGPEHVLSAFDLFSNALTQHELTADAGNQDSQMSALVTAA